MDTSTTLGLPRRALVWAAPLLLFVYLTLIRTRGISHTFWLLGDQIFYWRVALGRLRDLPLGGNPSQIGGTTIGPIFFWTLWIIRHLVGPWVDNFPHAGAIGLCILQSAADAFLFVALWQRSSSIALALAVILFAATAPYDMALTATIWNPPLAVALVKSSIACVILGGRDGRLRWDIGAVVTAMLSVQAHSSGIFFAAPVIGSITLRELLAKRTHRAYLLFAVSCGIVMALEIPYLVDKLLQPDKVTRPGAVVDSVAYTIAHPSSLRLAASFHSLINAVTAILWRPWSPDPNGILLVLCAAVTAYRLRRDVTFLCATVIPLVAAAAGFSLWQNTYDHYWYLVFGPCAAISIAWALTAWRPTARFVAIGLAVLVLCGQTTRIAAAQTIHRLPDYEALAKGSRAIRRYTPEVRDIHTEFVLPATTDPRFLYTILGGRITREAPFIATIRAKGDVTFTPVDEPAGSGR